ncbi:mfs transporter [Stylonychia lemnae]|uniref:Mfs transporter n=1 Tax=Stylonychia lemnae TaxID=5949 RepID=A0A078AUG5_STYLE|nr:mfs transporter [Stylonychia lemnae]|eukprot:CDW84867.1 mfs transporter [Stylonychia lemnae]
MNTKYHFQIDQSEKAQQQQQKYDLEEKFLSRPKNGPEKTIFKLSVKQGVTTINIISMIMVLFTMLQMLLFYEVSFVYFLQSEETFNLSTREASNTVGDLLFWTQVISIAFDILAGSTHDLNGRRLTIFFGFLIACSAMAVQPWIPSIYPGILITRSLIFIGLSGPGSSPLVADYVKNKSRGTASAYIGLAAGIGVIFGMFVLFGMTKELSYKNSYSIAAAFALSLAVFMLFGIKDVKFEKKHVVHLPLKEKIRVKFNQIKSELSTKIELPLCLLGALICRMLNVISTVYINLWLSTFFGRDQESQVQAKTLSASLNGTSMTLALICTCIIGILSDKFKPSNIFIIVFGISAFGALLFTFNDKPDGIITYISVICFNIGNQTQNIAIISLLYKTVEKGTRGTIIGLSNSMSAIGILILSKLGGFLFEEISIKAPFIFVGICDALFIILILILKKTGKLKK